mgnify:CR=1 FL=1
MGFLDTLLGRGSKAAKQVRPDRLFALTTASLDLQVSQGIVTTGEAAIVFQPLATILSQAVIADGHFSHGDTSVFAPLVSNLVDHDPFLVLADYRSYVDCQTRVSAAWRDPDTWSHMSILNTARSGKFSSDRAIAQYCDGIWHVPPMPTPLE